MESIATRQINPVFVIFFIIIGIPIIVYPTFQSMVQIWIEDSTFTHGFLVFPITLLLIWRKRTVLAAIPIQSEPKVLVLLALTCFVWLIATVAEAIEFQQFMLIAIIINVLWIMLGRSVVSQLLFPLLFLCFAVPLGKMLILTSIEISTNITTWLLSLTSIPVYQEQLTITLPNARLSMLDMFSGMNYLITALVLGLAFSYVTYTSLYKRLSFVALCLIMPILALGIRAYIIIIIKLQNHWQLPDSLSFLKQDWAYFVAISLLLLVIGLIFKSSPDNESAAIEDIHTPRSGDKNRISLALFIPALVLITAPVMYVSWLDINKQKDSPHNNVALAQFYGGWQLDSSHSFNWNHLPDNPDANQTQSYSFGNDVVQISISRLDKTQKAMLGATTTLPSNDLWRRISTTDLQEPTIYVTESELVSADNKILVWSWYRIGTYQTPIPHIARLLGAYNQFFAGKSAEYWITLATPLTSDKEYSRSQLRQLWREASDQIYTAMDRL